ALRGIIGRHRRGDLPVALRAQHDARRRLGTAFHAEEEIGAVEEDEAVGRPARIYVERLRADAIPELHEARASWHHAPGVRVELIPAHWRASLRRGEVRET